MRWESAESQFATPSQIEAIKSENNQELTGFTDKNLDKLQFLQEAFGICLTGKNDLASTCIHSRGLQKKILDILDDKELNDNKKAETIRNLVVEAKSQIEGNESSQQ